MKIKTILTLAVALLAFGVTSDIYASAKGDAGVNNSTVLVDLKSFPDWFKKAAARDTNVKRKTTLKLKEFNVKQKVLGKLKLLDQGDGVWYYTIDIGSGTPVECYVVSEFDGPANSLVAILESGMEGIAALNKKKLAEKYTYAIGSGLVGDTPYMKLDILYTLGEGAGKVTGVLKGLSAATSSSLQICMHNEVGYNDAHFNVFESFVQAFQSAEKNSAFFQSVLQMSVNGMTVGYGLEKYTADEEGDIHIQTQTSLLLPVDASALVRVDSATEGWSLSDGALINASQYSVENGNLASSLSIQMPEDKWLVEGELQGKPVQATLEYDAWLLSSYGSYIEAIALGNSKQNSAEFLMWVPEADPTVATKVVISKLQGDPAANFKVDMGPLVMKYMAEKNGIIKQGSIEQGPVTINFKLIHVKGQPALK